MERQENIRQALPERSSLTPMMQQWYDCKLEAGPALLLFRMGDFYEAFFRDAEVLAQATSINLTSRSNIPMSGIPHHQLETYLIRLLELGLHVSIAEQYGDPKAGPLERKIARTITPGTLTTAETLKDKQFNTIAALTKEGAIFGLAYGDITTPDLHCLESERLEDLISEIARLGARELLIPPRFFDPYPTLQNELTLALTDNDKSLFAPSVAHATLERHFSAHTLDSFGCKHMGPAVTAAAALLTFAKQTTGSHLAHIERLHHTPLCGAMAIDQTTEKNLELFASTSTSGKETSLFALLDKTLTPMGARKLRRWIARPLLDPEKISQRQSALAAFLADLPRAMQAREFLTSVRDLERLSMRITARMASPRDLSALGRSCTPLPHLKNLLAGFTNPWISALTQTIADSAAHIAEKLEGAITDDPPWRLSDGGVIRAGYNLELDSLRTLASDTGAWLSNYQERLRSELGVKNLKVAFNKVAGYYIEISRGQAHLAEGSLTRTQTLTNSERFTSPELKSFEERILHAEEQISRLEAKLFADLVDEMAGYCSDLQRSAESIAQIDVALALAITAHERGYCRPTVDMSHRLDIEGGRHPIVESAGLKSSFVPNDTHLCGQTAKLTLLTGPNMGGKSTYIRQTALITLLAQMGSFVPAQKAHIGIVDRLFSRIGATDDLARGQSTFMVEMAETAAILRSSTERSLILLDEIGRGTSTLDGIAIARAVAESLATAYPKGPRTLFATHFFELTALEDEMPGVKNAHVSVAEAEGKIILLHKICPGSCTKSYGIHVARLAGIPPAVVSRAEKILSSLEKGSFSPPKKKQASHSKQDKSKELLLFT